jgi:hypothetical protein
LKANTHFTTTQKSLLVLRACQDTTTTHAHTEKPENKTSLALIHPIPLADYNIKVLSINQKLIKIWKKKHYSN